MYPGSFHPIWLAVMPKHWQWEDRETWTKVLHCFKKRHCFACYYWRHHWRWEVLRNPTLQRWQEASFVVVLSCNIKAMLFVDGWHCWKIMIPNTKWKLSLWRKINHFFAWFLSGQSRTLIRTNGELFSYKKEQKALKLCCTFPQILVSSFAS